MALEWKVIETKHWENLKKGDLILTKTDEILFVLQTASTVNFFGINIEMPNLTFLYFNKSGNYTGIGGGHWSCFIDRKDKTPIVECPRGWNPEESFKKAHK